MGACYSKSGAGAALSPQDKAPGIRKRLSWRSKKRDRENSSVSRETESFVELHNSPQKVLPLTASVELDPLLSHKQAEERDFKTGDRTLLQATVAPSDSGIESIGTVQDDAQDQQGTQLAGEGEVTELKLRRKDHSVVTTSVDAEDSDSSSCDEASVFLSRQLQRLSRGSCHKCGNFKLDDSALTALLADTYCLCGLRRAGKPNVNPQCQTHGLRHQRSTISSHGGAAEFATDDIPRDQYTNISSSCDLLETNKSRTEIMPLKSSLKKGRSSELLEEGRSRRVSLKSEEESSALSYQNNLDDVFEDRESSQAMLNHIGSLEKSLENFSFPAEQRRSLLSEILDITNSICHCDFYSNEICCPSQEQQREVDSDISKSVQCVTAASTAQQQFSSHDAISKSTPVLYPSPIKKYLGPSKNVSFAKEKESKSSVTASEISLSKPPSSTDQQGIGQFERLSCVESMEDLVVSGSSSEEDVSNMDVRRDRDGFVDRADSLSYTSIQRLEEHSGDITGSVYSARRMIIDGCDSVVIPAEVYHQLEADVSMMKEQLQYLTSLMLEDEDNETTMYESDEFEESFA